MTIYAQAGYAKSDRIIRGLRDGSINGVIWSPKDEFPDSMHADIRIYKADFPQSIMLFDPQFYTTKLAGVKDRILQHYPYWRTLARSDFNNPANLRIYVQETLDYQLTLNVDRLLSPSIEIDSFGSPDCNISLSLANESVRYYNALRETHLDLPPLLISLIISEACLSAPSNFHSFLNDISIIQAAGFYIIVHRDGPYYKAAFEPNALENLIYLVYVLAEINSYEVICGYSDFVGALLCSVGAKVIGTGWFSNLKQFTTDRFLPSSQKRPARRRYSSQPLINSIFLDEMDTINNAGQLSSVLSGTTYDAVFTSVANPSNAPWDLDASTLHHWLVLGRLVSSVTGGSVQTNLNNCTAIIANAQNIYNNLSRVMPFNVYTGDHHLQQWQTAISNFRSHVGI